MLLLLSVITPAVAQYSTPIESFSGDLLKSFSVVTGASVRQDSNLFKRPTPVSDTISSGYVGLRVDKPYSQQRFQLDLTESTTRYDTNTRLNFNSLDYRGAWIWQLGSRLSGTLSADRKETLAPFEDQPGNNQRNVRNIENRAFNLDGWLFGGWHALAGVTEMQQKSELAFAGGAPDFRSTGGEVGIKYLTRAGNSIAGTQRSSRGEYLNLSLNPAFATLDNYHQDESEIKASWQLTGKSTVNGRMAWLERRNDILVQRDFSGLVGDLGYIWLATGKLSVNLGVQRNIYAYQSAFSTYRVSDTLSLSSAWKITDKTTATVRLSRAYSSGRGGTSGAANDSDIYDSSEILLDWVARRNLTVGGSLQRLHRSASDPSREFGATVGNLRASLMF